MFSGYTEPKECVRSDSSNNRLSNFISARHLLHIRALAAPLPNTHALVTAIVLCVYFFLVVCPLWPWLAQFVSGQVHVKDVRKRSKSLREFDIEEVSWDLKCAEFNMLVN